jgi:hypothetical protein
MKLITSHLVIMTAILGSGLSACTTVDLTQVAVNQPQTSSEKKEKNVVERASLSLVKKFHTKGWYKSDPAEKTKTATNVLLNGIDTDNQSENVSTTMPITDNQLIDDITEADYQVKQITKAAEVYLVVADDMAELDEELSQLEVALLSSREAQAGFVKNVNKLPKKSQTTRHKLEEISKSIDKLTTVTDAYGDRIRLQIAARASNAGS